MASRFVLDASAIVAVLKREPGADYVEARLNGAAASTVNIAEVGDAFLRVGGSHEALKTAIIELGLELHAPDLPSALLVSELLLPTRSGGLSLGDRFCIALARQLGRAVLTADRDWLKVADAIRVDVQLIR